MLARWLRLWRTVRHLRPVQIYGRIWFRLSRPWPDCSPAPKLRSPLIGLAEVAHRLPSLTGAGQFVFLNEPGTLGDHGWDDPTMPKLWRYNQHYFDDLNAIDACERTAWHSALVADWINNNPLGQGSGWEPYTTSLRIVNWIKWALRGNALPSDAVQSLAVQSRWLIRRLECHLLGNHLFANAKALVFAGLFFEGEEAEYWLRAGIRILWSQIPEQILCDGGHFELSPMYHALAIEDMLDLVNIARAFGRDDLADDWAKRVPTMLDWLNAMSHPDGNVAFFNDTAIGVAPANEELFDYAMRLGFSRPAEPGALTTLSSTGYVRLSAGCAVVIADVARIGPDYLPGHAHADTLSFELSLNERRVVVNSGTSVYGLGAERLRQRGTAAHSTVMIDGQNSSEVWSGFRVGRRAKPFDVTIQQQGNTIVAVAAHDGYSYILGAPVHRRKWSLESNALTVTDRIEGWGRHRIDLFLHFAPGISVHNEASGILLLEDETGKYLARLTTEGGEAETIPSSWHPEFGRAIQTQCLKLSAEENLPHAFSVRVEWSSQ